MVIDHHEADKISENACIINNQLCDYPTKSLSGCGMVYKFCCYLDTLLNQNYADYFLDLTALALISDMMDLKDFETRHLINKGLKQINNPFFNLMVQKQAFQLKDGLSPFGIAFYITPYINATIRMGSQNEKLLLFESMLEHKAYEPIPSTKRGCRGQMESKVEQACRNCTNIKNHQAKARDEYLNIIETIIANENLLNNKILAIRLNANQSADKNLTGLIANQLMSKYQRPVLLLNQVNTIINEQTEVSWQGSGRGYDKSKFDDFKEFLKKSGYVMYADGHANAFGTGIKDKDFETFINYSNQALAEFDFTPCYKVDFIFDGSNFKGQDIIELAELKSIWGQGVEEPYIAIENIKVLKENIVLMSPDKNPTLKITLPNGTSLIKFKSSQEEYDALHNEMGYIQINVVGKCERNIWNGIVSPQIIVEDYEIISEAKYYF